VKAKWIENFMFGMKTRWFK